MTLTAILKIEKQIPPPRDAQERALRVGMTSFLALMKSGAGDKFVGFGGAGRDHKFVGFGEEGFSPSHRSGRAALGQNIGGVRNGTGNWP